MGLSVVNDECDGDGDGDDGGDNDWRKVIVAVVGVEEANSARVGEVRTTLVTVPVGECVSEWYTWVSSPRGTLCGVIVVVACPSLSAGADDDDLGRSILASGWSNCELLPGAE